MFRLLQLGRSFTIVGLLVATARTQTLVHSYEFNGNGNDSTGAVNLANPNGGSFATSGLFTFGAGTGQGLRFVGESSLQSVYTIALRFSFTTTSNYGRVISFKDLADEFGTYVVSGGFVFYAVTGLGGAISPNTSVDFVLTRTSGGTVTGYVGGSQAFTFNDSSTSYAVASSSNYPSSSVFWFFQDNGNNENSAGSVDRIRIYSDAVASQNIAGLLTAVPEPATWGAIAGTSLLAIAIWRRRRRASRSSSLTPRRST